MKLNYSEDQIQRAFKKRSFLEEPESEDKKEEPKSSKHFKTLTIDDDRVDIDLKHGSVYINDELVTENTDVPKKVIKVLKNIIPKLAGKKDEE